MVSLLLLPALVLRGSCVSWRVKPIEESGLRLLRLCQRKVLDNWNVGVVVGVSVGVIVGVNDSVRVGVNVGVVVGVIVGATLF